MTLPSVRRGPKHFDISSAADLPAAILAPDGIMRVPLEENAKYLVHETFEWPRLFVPKQTEFFRFEPIDFLGARTVVRMEFDGANHGGSAETPMFWGRDIGSLRFDSVGWHDIGDAGAGHITTLFDLVGASGFSLLGASFLPAEQFKRIATLVDVALEFRPHALFDNQEGYVVRSNPLSIFPSNLAHSIAGTRFTQPNSLGTTAPMLVFQGSPVATVMGVDSIDQQAGDSFIEIDSGSADSQYILTGIGYEGGGGFFRPDISEAITSFANNDVAITSFSDSATNPGVDTTVNFGSIQQFTRGQFILIADEAAYDGLHQILRVSDDQQSFDINVVFSTGGAGTLKRTTVTVTAATSGMVEGETQTISGTTSYNETTEILSISANRKAFDIPVAFVADDATGTVVSTSKTEKSFGVGVENCGVQSSSKIIGAASSNGESTTTTPADGTYAAMSFGTLTDNTNIEQRITLTNATTGEFTYNGEGDTTLSFSGPLDGFKAGANRDYRFAPSINGAIPVFASDEYAPWEITSTSTNIYFQFFVDVSPGDTVQLMSAGDGTTDAFTVSDALLSLKEA